MRLSISLKFGLLNALLVVVVVAATSYALVYGLEQRRARQLVKHDQELAQVLAGLRTARGELDFDPLESFVDSADKVNLGLVYAIVLDRNGAIQRASLNPRSFGALAVAYQRQLIEQGRQRILEALAAGRIDRQGTITEYSMQVPQGQLRLGFDLRRFNSEREGRRAVALLVLCVGLLIGALGAVLLARNLTRPVRRLAAAMGAVAEGDLGQTVQVQSHDEIGSLAEAFNGMMRSLRAAGQLQQICDSYLSASITRRLLREGAPLELATEERAVTIMVLSLRGFAAYVREAAPRDCLSFLNEYLAPIVDAILAHEGVVLSLQRQRLEVAWGVPVDCPRGERVAVEAALALREAVADEARRQSVAGYPALQVAVGVATGRVAIGNTGSAQRATYAAVGALLEDVQAIEQLASPGEVLISEATYTKISEVVDVGAAPPLMLDGMEEAVPLYRVAGVADPKTSALF